MPLITIRLDTLLSLISMYYRYCRQLKTKFVKDNFFHYAFYNPIESQIEMHLASSGEQCVEVSTLNEKDISIRVSNTTEISRKFTRKF